MEATRTCSIDGCGRRERLRRDMCNLHYRRLMRNGDPAVTRYLPPGTHAVCVIDGCGGKHESRGWCRQHYRRWQEHGDPLYVRPKLICSVNGCGRDHYGRGWCEMHYQRARKHGDPEVVKKGGVEVGRFAGDQNPSWSGDMVGYFGVHMRLRKLRGRAREHACVDCSGPATQWSYDHADPNEKVSESGAPYSIDPNHYQPRCQACHKEFDDAPIGVRGRLNDYHPARRRNA